MKKPLILLLASLFLVLILYFGFTNKPPKRTVYDDLREKLIDSLHLANGPGLEKMDRNMKASSGDSRVALLKELASDWAALGQYDITADYLRQLADADPSYGNYMMAGTAFLQQIGSEQDDDVRRNIVYGAKYSFEQALALAPDSLDARIDLASVYVEGMNPPMQGIQMLLALDEKYPGNEKINMELGRFSLMSGQFDKALARFQTVLAKDSLNLQAHYLGARAWLGVNDTASALGSLEQATKLTTDPDMLDQLRQEIYNLQNH